MSGLPVTSRVNEIWTSINKIPFEIHLMELGLWQDLTSKISTISPWSSWWSWSAGNSVNFRIRGRYQDFSRSRRTSCLLLLAAACTGHRGIEFIGWGCLNAVVWITDSPPPWLLHKALGTGIRAMLTSRCSGLMLKGRGGPKKIREHRRSPQPCQPYAK